MKTLCLLKRQLWNNSQVYHIVFMLGFQADPLIFNNSIWSLMVSFFFVKFKNKYLIPSYIRYSVKKSNLPEKTCKNLNNSILDSLRLGNRVFEMK